MIDSKVRMRRKFKKENKKYGTLCATITIKYSRLQQVLEMIIIPALKHERQR